MTVLSRALIRKMILREMFGREDLSKKKQSRTGMKDLEDATVTDIIDIDNDTEIDSLPDIHKDDFDFDDFDDDDFEFESETEEDSESETEYNPGRHVMDMSGDEIRRHVMSQAERLSPDMSVKNRRTRAEMQYDDLVRQGRELEMPDPEFQDTAELPPYEKRKKHLRENINKRIRQSIRRQILLL